MVDVTEIPSNACAAAKNSSLRIARLPDTDAGGRSNRTRSSTPPIVYIVSLGKLNKVHETMVLVHCGACFRCPSKSVSLPIYIHHCSLILSLSLFPLCLFLSSLVTTYLFKILVTAASE